MYHRGFLDNETSDQLYLLWLITKYSDGLIVTGSRRQEPEYKKVDVSIHKNKIATWSETSKDGFEYANSVATALTQQLFAHILVTEFDLIEIVAMQSSDGLYSQCYTFWYLLHQGLEPQLQIFLDSFGDLRRIINGGNLDKAVELIDGIIK